MELCHTYLRQMKRNWTKRRPVIYPDEIWMNAHSEKDKAWVEKTTITGSTLGGI